MERSRVWRGVSGSSSSSSMFEKSRCHLRDRDDANSFWSNLRPNVDHGQQQQHAHHPHVADVDLKTPSPPPHPCTDDQEISVFDARKYLNNELSIINDIDTQKVITNVYK